MALRVFQWLEEKGGWRMKNESRRMEYLCLMGLGTGRMRPFSSGMQRMDWQDANCCRCKKYTGENGACEVDDAISLAACGDGTVSAEIAKRMGYASPLAYCWQCLERLAENTARDARK
jgi:hypothetical protein